MIRTRLTKPRMWAIENALIMRLSLVIETGLPNRTDYEMALRWIQEEIAARSKRAVDRERRL
jgi:hypothetical protein